MRSSDEHYGQDDDASIDPDQEPSDCYEALGGLPMEATQEEVRARAVLVKGIFKHDLFMKSPRLAPHAAFFQRRATNAEEILTNPRLRRIHDEKLRAQRRGSVFTDQEKALMKRKIVELNKKIESLERQLIIATPSGWPGVLRNLLLNTPWKALYRKHYLVLRYIAAMIGGGLAVIIAILLIL